MGAVNDAFVDGWPFLEQLRELCLVSPCCWELDNKAQSIIYLHGFMRPRDVKATQQISNRTGVYIYCGAGEMT